METKTERFKRSTKYLSDQSDDNSYQRTLAHTLACGSVVKAVKRRINTMEEYKLEHMPRAIY